MGNQSTHLHQAAQQAPPAAAASSSSAAGAEPLESFMKEKQRDEHLKNLGFKRSKSLRRSISKKLKRKRKRDGDAPDGGGGGGGGPPGDGAVTDADGPKAESQSGGSKERVPSIERLDRADVPEAERRPKPAVGNPEPLPSHVSVCLMTLLPTLQLWSFTSH